MLSLCSALEEWIHRQHRYPGGEGPGRLHVDDLSPLRHRHACLSPFTNADVPNIASGRRAALTVPNYAVRAFIEAWIHEQHAAQ
jgi:hypothetical protein